MLTQVILDTASPRTLDIANVDPDDILILTNITGLSPGDVTLFTGDFARDGGYYQGRRATKRNPVLTFKLNPNYAEGVLTSDIREILYRTFYEPKVDSNGVRVVLVDDTKPNRYFIGYTEKIETNIFSKTQEAQVSMVCVDPYLRSVDITTDTDEDGWISIPLTYEGSARTGLEFFLKVISPTDTISISNNGRVMVLEGDFAADDIIHINTMTGQRFIKVNNVDMMVIKKADSPWIELSESANEFVVYGDTPGDGAVRLTHYEYQAAWWGV